MFHRLCVGTIINTHSKNRYIKMNVFFLGILHAKWQVLSLKMFNHQQQTIMDASWWKMLTTISSNLCCLSSNLGNYVRLLFFQFRRNQMSWKWKLNLYTYNSFIWFQILCYGGKDILLVYRSLFLLEVLFSIYVESSQAETFVQNLRMLISQGTAFN